MSLLCLICMSTNGLYLMNSATVERSEIIRIENQSGAESNQKILIELFLAAERKADFEQIKKELEAVQITRIRTQFFKLGNPPQNIAIGKDIPASIARLAIRLAKTYNRDIKYILPEYRFFPDHIVIGSSAYDEKSQIPITPEDLEKLSDPSLSTEAFHTLYRHLTGEDTRLPKYTD